MCAHALYAQFACYRSLEELKEISAFLVLFLISS